MGATTACLVPPDLHIAPAPPNTDPRIDLDSLDPAASLFEADEACACFRIRATLYDDDDDALLVRIATNVGRDGNRARCALEESRGPAGLGQPLEVPIIPAEFLAGFPGESVHTISMYVTDADAFLSPTLDANDCARLPSEDGGEARHVVEQRWTVRFIPGLGQCPNCGPPPGG